jgi:hypothetical protein
LPRNDPLVLSQRLAFPGNVPDLPEGVNTWEGVGVCRGTILFLQRKKTLSL